MAGQADVGIVLEHGDEFERQQARVLTVAEADAVSAVMFRNGAINADVVGKSAFAIAKMAGVDVPAETSVLIAKLDGVGDAYPLSGEKLSPVLAFYEAPDLDTAINLCLDLNYFGGTGHTAAMYSNDDQAITRFATMMNAGRVVVNTPSSRCRRSGRRSSRGRSRTGSEPPWAIDSASRATALRTASSRPASASNQT